MMVIITAEMSLCCITITVKDIQLKEESKLNASNRCMVKEEQRKKAKRRKEQLVEYISKFRCKTNSVI